MEEILVDLHLVDAFFGIETGIDASVLEDEAASRAYLRGASSVEWFHHGIPKKWEVPAGNSFCFIQTTRKELPFMEGIFTDAKPSSGKSERGPICNERKILLIF